MSPAAKKRKKPAAPPARVQFLIEEPRWRNEAQALRLMRRALRLVIEDAAPFKARERNLVVLLADDAKLRSLNFDFKGQNKATNVLSFPPADLEKDYLGDIALAFGVVKKEAREQNKSFAAHAAHLAAHGALHLLGYNHENKNDALKMESLEIRLLGRIRVANPYAPRLYTRAGRPA